MSQLTAKTTRLKLLIEAPGVLLLPGVYDGYSMRLVERHGFEAAFVTGAGIAEAVTGYPDVGLMNAEENLFITRRLAGMSTVPLLADVDTGYGNALNVYHTVRTFEQAGVAGVVIEDQTWPKRCGHMPGKTVIGAAEMVDKVRAAVAARADRDFIIEARTDAAATDGLDEAIRRLNLYGDAGADLLFADALDSADAIKEVASSVSKPLCVNMGFGIRTRSTTPLLSPMQLAEMGVAAAIYPRLLTSSAVRGMSNGLAALDEQVQTGTVRDRTDLSVSFEELNDLVGAAEVAELEHRFVDLTVGGIR